MLTENNNIKDRANDLDISVTDTSFPISYKKTHKLIIALYMVTDIIDKEEPIRNKLRNLGAEIISDMHSSPKEANSKITEIVSFLNIASTMNFISEMNYSILKKEFLELKESVREYLGIKPQWLEDFFQNSSIVSKEASSIETSLSLENLKQKSIGHVKSYGQQTQINIGVQKGSTLLKALSKVEEIKALSSKTFSNNIKRKDNFNLLKKQRRNDIINVLKIVGGGLTIKDIKDEVETMSEKAKSLVSCSEKTLQRELASMVKDDVLYKTGEKRWSKYGLVSSD